MCVSAASYKVTSFKVGLNFAASHQFIVVEGANHLGAQTGGGHCIASCLNEGEDVTKSRDQPALFLGLASHLTNQYSNKLCYLANSQPQNQRSEAQGRVQY